MMTTLNLDSQNVQILVGILECAVDDLREEIRHTDNLDFKESLKQHHESLSALRCKFVEKRSMKSFEIEEQDVKCLNEIIETRLDDLRVQIRHSSNYYFKEMLKHQRELLMTLQRKLKVSHSESMVMPS